MTRIRSVLLVAAFLSAPLPGMAATPGVDAPQAPQAAGARPRIGLVLGGGGAMGAAHIGVIKVLEEMHVPVDCVAGTSMGALVGGAFSSGMSGAELDRFVTSIDWQGVFSTQQVRRYQPVSVKRENETVSNKLEFGLGEDGLIAPGGLIDTQQIESTIRNMVSGQGAVKDFNQLPIPFRAVATDLKSGRMVVFDSGELPVVLRASMSVPGAFAPLELGDWLLVDGGITRNLPVDVAREACADIVIAVAVDTQDPPVSEMRSATGAVARMVDILIGSNEQASLAELGPGDVGLRILLEDVGSTDFLKARSAIDQGEQAARRIAGQLARLSVPDADYARWRTEVAGRMGAPSGRTVAQVRFEGADEDTARWLSSLIRTGPGEPLDESQIADDALRIYATGQYQSVAHRVEGDGQASVVFTPVLKPWGPTFLAFDYGVEAGSGSRAEVLVSAMLRRTWPESTGAEWRSLAQLGAESRLETDLRLPLGATRHTFVMPRLAWMSELEDVFLDGSRIATYEFRNLRGELRFGVEMGTWGEIQAGLYGRRDDNLLNIGLPLLPEEKGYEDAGYLFEFERDTRDSDVWATRGSRQRLEVVASEPGLGADERYQTALIEWNESGVWRRNALIIADFAGGTAFGGSPSLQQSFRLGGPGQLSALQRGELRGSDFLYTRLGLGWRVPGLDTLLGMTLFAGAAFEAGAMWTRALGEDLDDTRLGGQLFLGGNTPFGPVTASFGFGESGDYAAFIGIGRPVRGRWR
jgi:NTE family protein